MLRPLFAQELVDQLLAVHSERIDLLGIEGIVLCELFVGGLLVVLPARVLSVMVRGALVLDLLVPF